jgi:hypothetical protein
MLFDKVSRGFILSAEEKRFMRHNNILQASGKCANCNVEKQKKASYILLELNDAASAIISYSYLARTLAKDESTVFIAYHPSEPINFLSRVYWKIQKFIGSRLLAIYKSFGISELLVPTLDGTESSEAEAIYRKIRPTLKTKQDVENLSIDGVEIGDLVYDSYLAHYRTTTLDVESDKFNQYLKYSIRNYVFWSRYFDENNVVAINVSHCVYLNALPLRIALIREIASYQVNATHVYRLSKENRFAYSDYHYFPEQFKKLPIATREDGLRKAKERIEIRLSGEVGVDMPYSTKSAYGNFKPLRLIKESDRLKVLIAPHCFFDSPHPYGHNLFPDCYEWLHFITSIAEKTNYDWYVKTHPDFIPETKLLIEEFFRNYPKFTMLPSDSSHRQIVSEGIDVALTIYGTIGFEYASMGVRVVNASMNNPHIAYGFNIHPNNIEEFEDILLSLPDRKIDIKQSEVQEYYFMRNIYNNNNWLFKDYAKMIAALGGYRLQFTPAVYDYWLKEWDPDLDTRVLNNLEVFIKSREFRLTPIDAAGD